MSGDEHQVKLLSEDAITAALSMSRSHKNWEDCLSEFERLIDEHVLSNQARDKSLSKKKDDGLEEDNGPTITIPSDPILKRLLYLYIIVNPEPDDSFFDSSIPRSIKVKLVRISEKGDFLFDRLLKAAKENWSDETMNEFAADCMIQFGSTFLDKIEYLEFDEEQSRAIVNLVKDRLSLYFDTLDIEECCRQYEDDPNDFNLKRKVARFVNGPNLRTVIEQDFLKKPWLEKNYSGLRDWLRQDLFPQEVSLSKSDFQNQLESFSALLYSKLLAEGLQKLRLYTVGKNRALDKPWYNEDKFESKDKLTTWRKGWLDESGNINIFHGGGFYHILDYLSGESPGYKLDISGCGMYVTPSTGRENELPGYSQYRTECYANNRHHFFDKPAIFRGKIPPDRVQVVRNAYEAVLFPAQVKEVTDIEVTSLDSSPTFKFTRDDAEPSSLTCRVEREVKPEPLRSSRLSRFFSRVRGNRNADRGEGINGPQQPEVKTFRL